MPYLDLWSPGGSLFKIMFNKPIIHKPKELSFEKSVSKEEETM